MKFITAQSLDRPEVLRWHRRIVERYTPPRGIKLTVLLPCSAKKPYSKSKSHMLFRRHIRRGAREKLGLLHEVVLTSPLGIVPRELENLYPAAHYDTPVTGHWSREEKDIVVRLLSDYMEKAKTRVIGHVDGAYREICRELGIGMTPQDISSEESLGELEEEISVALEGSPLVKIDRRLEGLRKICDFQFGLGSSDHLMPEGARMKGSAVFLDDEQVAAINPATGFLALSLAGGRLLKDYGRHLVEISFKPETNSIFCVGVEKAGEEVRPNDEVIVVYKGKVVGVGRAVLNGEEMVRAKRGLAIRLRHRA
jgi:archaeosine synthase